MSICVRELIPDDFRLLLISYRFVHAPSSRAKLSVTRKMLLTTATYQQIMPQFLDFLFSFGSQHHPKDFFFAGFRHETRLSQFHKSAAIPALGRSDRTLQLCYSLKTVESSSSQEDWPWSIRGIVTHHAFDLETGRANWMIVKGKGGASMKDRIMLETKPQSGTVLNKFDCIENAFSSTISTHLLQCNWSIENWRWYINYMEQEVQKITRKTLSVSVAEHPTESRPKVYLTRTQTGILEPPKKTSTAKSLAHAAPAAKTATTPAPPPVSQGPGGPPGPPPPLSSLGPPKSLDGLQPDSDFSFKDLQRIEFIEEHANEAMLVITLNSNILAALAQHYNSIVESPSCPGIIKSKCAADLRRLVDRISDIRAEFKMQRARMETLLRLLANRKALVCMETVYMD